MDKLSEARIGKEVILALYVVKALHRCSTISMRVLCYIALSMLPTRKGRMVFRRDGPVIARDGSVIAITQGKFA